MQLDGMDDGNKRARRAERRGPATDVDWVRVPSPVGPLVVTANERGDALTSLSFGGEPPAGAATRSEGRAPVLARAVRQLEEYFAGRRRAFDLPLAPRGTAFQLRVWDALRAIPYAETRSYRDVAEALEQPTATRAVGGANGKNPIAIVVPCHRVIGGDGTLTGFGGGLRAKVFLLALERLGPDGAVRALAQADALGGPTPRLRAPL